MHDETDLARTRANMAALAENLRAAGLDLPSAAPAYLGALYAGASPEQAFEAARRQALLELPPRAPGDYNREPGRRFLPHWEVEQAIAARAAAIARIRGLANPFSEPATAYLEQAA